MVSSEDSSATQPYIEEECEQQLMDSGCSTCGKKSNAAGPVQQPSGSLSTVPCQKPSPGCSTSVKQSNAGNPVQLSCGNISSVKLYCGDLSPVACRTTSPARAGGSSREKSNAANQVLSCGDLSPEVCRTPSPGHTSCSSSREKLNAASPVHLTWGDLSPVVCRTPSPLHPHRANFKRNAAVAAHSMRPCVSPAGTSPARDCHCTSPARDCVTIACSQPVSKSLDCPQIEQRYGDPLRTGKDDVLPRKGDSENGTSCGRSLSHFGQAGGSSPSSPIRCGASGSTTPVGKECEGRTGRSPTVGVKRVCEVTEHTHKRRVARALFSPSHPEMDRKISPNVAPSLVEPNCQSMHRKTCDVQADRTRNVLPYRPNGQICEIARVPERNGGRPCSHAQIGIREEGTDEPYRHVFGDQQPVHWPTITEHLQAFGRLRFTTAFQVLQWLNGKPLETLSVEFIEKLNSVEQATVQTYLCRLFDQECRELSREEKSCIKNPRFECCVNRNGRLLYKISEQREGLTALQRCFGPDRVLRVFFADGQPKPVYSKVMQEGIVLGLRHYQYWTHKDTGKDGEKKKTVDGEFWSSTHCYFVCTSSQAESDKSDPRFRQFRNIREARCLIMHIHTTPNEHKYSSRLQLALSQTQPVDLDFSTIDVQLDKDIVCKDKTGRETISTDGTGFISVDLAREIATSLKKGKTDPDKLFGEQDYPSLIQIRLFHKGTANKGTLLTNHLLSPRTIVLRDSMQKVKADPRLSDFPSFNSLEICGYSMPTRDAKLSRDLIMLLTLGGVPGSFFMDILDEQIRKTRILMSNPKTAWDAIQDHRFEKADMARRMLAAGIPPKEPFLQKTIMDLRKDLLQDFRKGRVSLPNSCYLYGAADPTGTLKPNQVAIARADGLVSWPKVAVYKSPGKHPGDIHIFEAISNTALHNVVGSGQFVILFSTQGPRSVPDEIANGDLDGDRYFITWNTKLLAEFVECETRWLPKPVKSNEQTMCRPADLSSQQLEEKLIEKFINTRFNTSGDIGTVSNWWLAHMDLYLSLGESDRDEGAEHYKKAKELIDILYDFLDSEKTGIKVKYTKHLFNPGKSPHFLEKTQKGPTTSPTTYIKDRNFGFGVYNNDDEEYKSTTILGQIYDKAVQAEESWRAVLYDELDFEQAFHIREIKGNKIPVTDLISKWKKLFGEYRGDIRAHIKATEMSDDSLQEARNNAIFNKFKKILFDAETLDKSPRDMNTLFAEATAIYAVVFEAVRVNTPTVDGGHQPLGFQFAWMVAGLLLCKMYEKYHRQDGKEPWTFADSALDTIVRKPRNHDILEKSASPNQEEWNFD